MLRLITSVFPLIILFCSSFASAGLVQLGSLSRDTTSNVVTDSEGLEWLMWDYEDHYTWETLNNDLLTGSGALAGWRVAQETDVFSMMSNAGWSHPYMGASCFDNDESTLCGFGGAARNTDQLFSSVFNDLFFDSETMFSSTNNYAFFLTDEHSRLDALGDNIGIMGVEHWMGTSSSPRTFLQTDWGRTLPESDRWTQLNSGQFAIRYALVRDYTELPLPSTFMLVLLGGFLMMLRRRPVSSNG